MTAALSDLLERVRGTMSPKRFAHTEGVMQTTAAMAALYCPESAEWLSAAALLHDSTKEYSAEQTAEVLVREGIVLRPDEAASPQILHAITAPAEILRLYPDYATPQLLSAVRWHTTGRAGMTVPEAILYLADVIEPTRTYPACVVLRERFWSADPAGMDDDARRAHLYACVLASLEGVRDSLLLKNAPVCRDTLDAIADLKLKNTL